MRPTYRGPVVGASVGLSAPTEYAPYDFHCPQMASKNDDDYNRDNYWRDSCAYLRYGKACQCDAGDNLRREMGLKVKIKRKPLCACGNESMSDGYLSKYTLEEPTCRCCWDKIKRKREAERAEKKRARESLWRAMARAKKAGVL